jgi:hypothetical protein
MPFSDETVIQVRNCLERGNAGFAVEFLWARGNCFGSEGHVFAEIGILLLSIVQWNVLVECSNYIVVQDAFVKCDDRITIRSRFSLISSPMSPEPSPLYLYNRFAREGRAFFIKKIFSSPSIVG